MGLLDDRVAVISGIGPGLGRSIALELAGQGADVALGARRSKHLESVAAEVEALGRRAVWETTDVARPSDCEALVSRAIAELGGVDIVVNSAAAFEHLRFEQGDFERWSQVMQTCLIGSLQLTYAALPSMRARGGGRVINIGSMATRDFQPHEGPYAAAKSALLAATRTLARELGADGIRVNCVNPGYIQGPPIQGSFKRRAAENGTTPAQEEARIVERLALDAIPEPDEIAGSVVFLASELSRPITGHVLDCNAGYWM